jgi:hypothetical protein
MRASLRACEIWMRSSRFDSSVTNLCEGCLFRFAWLLYGACDQLGLGAIEAWADTLAWIAVEGGPTVEAVTVVKENEKEEEWSSVSAVGN